MRRLILLLAFVIGATTLPHLSATAAAGQVATGQADQYVRQFYLTHVSAQVVQARLVQLSDQTSTKLTVSINRDTNSVTVRATEPGLTVSEAIIRQLDVPQAVTPPAATPGQATPPPAAAPAAPQSNRLPNLPMLPSTTNIQLELTITDTLSGTPATKTVSMVILNGSNGMIRTSTPGYDHQLNVDAMASAYQNGLIGVRLTLVFQPPNIVAEGKATQRAPFLNESLTVVVSDGKPLVVSQSADAASDRKVTATIKATVLK